MDYKEKIKELRLLLPVPMSEALDLLKNNGGDVEQCVYVFKAKSVKYICEQTGCSEQTANKYYEEEKFDINRAITDIKEEQFDLNYKPIKGLTLDGLKAVSEWIYLNEDKDFPTSLDYLKLNDAVDAMQLIPSLKEVADVVLSAKKIKDAAFEGYKDLDDISDFVRRHQKVDDNPDFQKYEQYCRLKMTVMKDEITRHKRNLIKLNEK